MESKTITINLGDADAEDVKDIILNALADEGYETEDNETSITIKADEDESGDETESSTDGE